MRRFSAQEVEANLDELLETLAESGPIAIQVDDHDVAVLLSPQDYEALTKGHGAPSDDPSDHGKPLLNS